MKKRFDGINLFAGVSCIVIALMFVVTTCFIIAQSLSAISAYNNVNTICFAQLSDLKEYFTSTISQEIYSLIYSFMSTAIVGLGAYILKNNNDTKNKIKKNIEELSEKQYIVAKKQLERDVAYNVLISNVSISHQYICAIQINSIKGFTTSDFYFFIESIKKTKKDLQNIKAISREQQKNILSILDSVKNKLSILTYEGLIDPPNDEGKTATDYLNDAIHIVENIDLV